MWGRAGLNPATPAALPPRPPHCACLHGPASSQKTQLCYCHAVAALLLPAASASVIHLPGSLLTWRGPVSTSCHGPVSASCRPHRPHTPGYEPMTNPASTTLHAMTNLASTTHIHLLWRHPTCMRLSPYKDTHTCIALSCRFGDGAAVGGRSSGWWTEQAWGSERRGQRHGIVHPVLQQCYSLAEQDTPGCPMMKMMATGIRIKQGHVENGF